MSGIEIEVCTIIYGYFRLEGHFKVFSFITAEKKKLFSAHFKEFTLFVTK